MSPLGKNDIFSPITINFAPLYLEIIITRSLYEATVGEPFAKATHRALHRFSLFLFIRQTLALLLLLRLLRTAWRNMGWLMALRSFYGSLLSDCPNLNTTFQEADFTGAIDCTYSDTLLVAFGH